MTVVVSPVPALAAAARRRLIARFRDAGAISEATAIPHSGGRLIERRLFERMRRAGVILDADGGRYWLDEGRAAKWNADRRKRGLVAAAALLTAGAIALGFGLK
jgi:hypothetical protein